MSTNSINNLPSDWAKATLKEVGEVITGNTPHTSHKEYYGGSMPFIKPPSLVDRPIIEADESISIEGEKHARIIPPETVLVSCIGNLGKTGITTKKSAFNQQINAVIFLKGIEPRYGFYACQLLRPFLEEVASATTISIVNKNKFSEAPILIAPLQEQHRIVAKIEELFTKLDAGVEALKKIKAQLKRYRQAVLKYAFEGKLTEEWRKTHKSEMEPASVLLKRIKEKREKNGKGKIKDLPPVDISDLPALPEGWLWTRLGETAEINPKFHEEGVTDDIEVTFLPMKCVEELTGHIDLSFTRRLSEVKKGYTPFIDGDLLFAKITPCMENGKVAIAHSLKNGIGFGSTEFHIIRLPESLPRKFFFFFLIRETLRKDAQRNMTGSAGQLRVPVNYIQRIPISLPHLPEQHKVVEEIERRLSVADEMAKVVDQGLKRAERLRQSILKKAFEGKLVPQDPNDEPAEKLLERIKMEKAKQEAKERTKKKSKNKIDIKQMELI